MALENALDYEGLKHYDGKSKEYIEKKITELDSEKVDKTTVATSSTLGLVKSGTDITVDSSGNVSVNDNSHKHTVSNISDLTATASELNVLDGITATTTELNYVDGVTSNIQTQLNSKVPTARKVNGKALSSDITLSASDVGADASGSASSALSDAKDYTDSKIASEVTARNSAIDTAKSSAISTASTDATTKANNALASAKTYTDTKTANLASTSTVDDKISAHNTSTSAHSDIRDSISTLQTEVTTHKNTSNPHGINKSTIGLGNVENKSSATIRSEITKDNVTTALGYTPIDAAKKGVANGLAELDANGKVPSNQLPSYVDDVIEGYLYNGKFYKESAHTTVITGESGKIYIDLSTNKTYRWSGSAYVVISETLALGENPSTAYRGDRGKIAYDHSQSAHFSGNYNDLTNKPTIPTVGNGTITITQNGVSKGTFTTNQSGNTTIELTDTNTDTKYTLPEAGASLGGVKSGGDVTISGGVITVNDDSHNHVISNIDGLQDALDKANDIQIGGRNLLKPKTNGGGNTTGGENYNITISPANNDTYFIVYPYEPLVGGEKYTISFNCESLAEGVYYQWCLFEQKDSSPQYKMDKNGRHAVTFIVPTNKDGTTQIMFDDIVRDISNQTDNVILTKFKLEKGNKATDWTPSLEDIQEAINGKADLNLSLSSDGKLTGSLEVVNRYNLGSYYNYENGYLIEIGTACNVTMVMIHITGNSYGNLRPIDSLYQFYDYDGNNGIINSGARNLGSFLGAMTVYRYNGKLYAYIKQTGSYQTLSFELITNRTGLTPKVTNTAAHTSGYTDLITITPDNVAVVGHTHNYLPLSGGKLTGELEVDNRIKAYSIYPKDCTKRIDSTGAGWYRIYTSDADADNATGKGNCSFSLGRNFVSPSNEAYKFSISVGYSGTINITQLSGYIGGHLITKIRVVYKNSKTFYVDFYTNASASTYYNDYYVYDCVGIGTFQTPTLVSSLDEGYSAYEFTTVSGCKSDRGFTGDLTGNASTATKLATARTISLTGSVTGSGTFDGSGNLSITTTTNHDHSSYVNQNAFSNVKVGSTTIAADTTTDTLTLAGSNVTLTPDATNDKVTIGITKQNVIDALGYTPGSTTDNNTTYTLTKSGSTITLTGSDGSKTSVTDTDTNTHYTTGITAGASGTTSNAAASNPYIKIKDDSTHRGQIQLKGGGATTVSSDANGVITISSTDTNTQYTHPNSGVTAGTYRSVTVNAQGHVTAGSNPTLTVAQGGTGATDAATARSNLGITPANIGAAPTHSHPYAGSSSQGGAANYLSIQNDNEINFKNATSTSAIYFNYKNADNGSSSGNTAIKQYRFCNKNGSETGVTLYAESFSGNSATATALTSKNIGSSKQPVYFDANGKPAAIGYTIEKSVPSNAVFTDTTYSKATSSALGLVKIGYTASGKNYPVQLNDSGQMYVNVPWTDNNTVYSHPTYTARTGKPTANQTPAFGGTATISQIISDGTGHVTGMTDRTITIPSTLSNGSGTAGLIKTTSTVTSNSGYTACPVINGVPYYKDTDSNTDTKNTAGATEKASTKMYLIGALAQTSNPPTYSNKTAYIGLDGHLYSNSKQVVNLSDSQALTNKTYNGYTLSNACAKTALEEITVSGVSNSYVPTVNALVNWNGAIDGKSNLAYCNKGAFGDAVTRNYTTAISATSAKETYVPTASAIANWDGSIGGDSNLAYCNKGAFGDAVTRGVDTTPTSGSSNLITSGAMYTALAGKLGTSDTAASATKVYSTASNPTDAYYYIPVHTGNTSDNKSLSNINGFLVRSKAGTTSTEGAIVFTLGNATATGADGNKYGVINLYGKKTYNTLLSAGNSSANRNISLPDSSGTLSISSSDVRLKENIKDTEEQNALSVVNSIKFRQFDWKETGKHQKIGVIADELELIDEHLVLENTGGYYEETDEDGNPEMNVKCVDTFYLMGYYGKAIQELSNENATLREEIKELKDLVSALINK